MMKLTINLIIFVLIISLTTATNIDDGEYYLVFGDDSYSSESLDDGVYYLWANVNSETFSINDGTYYLSSTPPFYSDTVTTTTGSTSSSPSSGITETKKITETFTIYNEWGGLVQDYNNEFIKITPDTYSGFDDEVGGARLGLFAFKTREIYPNLACEYMVVNYLGNAKEFNIRYSIYKNISDESTIIGNGEEQIIVSRDNFEATRHFNVEESGQYWCKVDLLDSSKKQLLSVSIQAESLTKAQYIKYTLKNKLLNDDNSYKVQIWYIIIFFIIFFLILILILFSYKRTKTTIKHKSSKT